MIMYKFMILTTLWPLRRNKRRKRDYSIIASASMQWQVQFKINFEKKIIKVVEVEVYLNAPTYCDRLFLPHFQVTIQF